MALALAVLVEAAAAASLVSSSALAANPGRVTYACNGCIVEVKGR